MWMRWVVVLLVGCRTLAPDETRCTSTPVFGTLVTNCKTGAPAPVERERPVVTRASYSTPAAPAVVDVSDRRRWWWCVGFARGELGSCYRDQDPCEARREVALAADASTSHCNPQRTAACFRVLLSAATGGDEMCHPTLHACDRQREYAIEHPDEITVLGDCRNME